MAKSCTGPGRLPQLLPVTEDVKSDATAALLLIDPQGRVADYQVAHGEATQEMKKNSFCFLGFSPATSFSASPMWGYKLVLFFPPTSAARS